MAATSPRTLLVISQVYVPDPTSVGQHMHDAAAEMARRGYRVIALASRAGYDDPAKKYKWRETIDGVHVRRLPLSSFGKGSVAIRMLAGLIFVIQCIALGLLTRRLAGIVVSTSPPIAPLAAIPVGLLRRRPITFWAMDLNPDQMIALGKTTPTSLPARIFEALNRATLRRSRAIIALDRFMADRLYAKLPDQRPDIEPKMHVMPPWPHDDHLEVVEHAANPFRHEHGLDGRFVIMHSGNHSLAHPLTTLLDAAARFKDHPQLVFMFVGGGVGKKDVDRFIADHKPANIRSLPYQPLDAIKYSLSAADVHVVAVGDSVVGINHPCKVYGSLALGRPVLLVGPAQCHVSDIIDAYDCGWHIRHGDADAAVTTIEQILALPTDQIAAKGANAARAAREQFNKAVLCKRFCDVIEAGL
jgi:colanic acid biosynthesis glycosyl transferase WcaI